MTLVPRDEAVAAAGSVLARVLDDLDSKSPRQAALDACRGRPHADVTQIEDLIRADRGLAPLDRSVGAQTASESPGRTAAPPKPRRPGRSATKPQEDPLAAVADLSAAERLALADAIRAEHG